MALLALGLQLLVIYSGLGDLAFLRRVLFVLSYLLLLLFVAANWRRVGIAIIGVGLVMNLLPILANGGLMPVTPETIERVGVPHWLEVAEEGEAIPGSKNVLLPREDTRFWPLSDVLVWDNPTGIRAFSVGDVVILFGLAVTLVELLAPRPRGAAPGSPGPAGPA